jgi:hypothetical protein
MPGKRITNRQVASYMRSRQADQNQKKSAESADFSERTARRLDRGGRTAKTPRDYRTRADPFAAVWEPEVLPLLRQDAQLKAVTLLGELQRRHPGEYAIGQLRTLERRIRQWRSAEGPPRSLIFPQDHPPGWQALLDFTVCNELTVTIGGTPLPHRLGHVCCPASGWQFAQVILGGESFPALAETVRLAFESLGGVPKTLRTDSLSAAYKNLRQQEDLTARFAALCQHYGCAPTRNTLGVAHENGAVESPNGHLKSRLDQALRLRGSRDFTDLDAYRKFVTGVIAAANAPRAESVNAERLALAPLPRFRPVTWTEAVGTVSRSGLIAVLGVSYLVPSRLIGHRLVVRIYDDHLEFFAGTQRVHEGARVHDPNRTRQVSYHHCIDSLVRKPGAFARLIYRDDLHPSAVYARTWDQLRERQSEHQACRTYVRLLHLAHRHACESALGKRLEILLERGELPEVEQLRIELAGTRSTAAIPMLQFHTAEPADYDRLRCLPVDPTGRPDDHNPRNAIA